MTKSRRLDFQNRLVSLTHAALTGLLALYIFGSQPKYLLDPEVRSGEGAYTPILGLLCLSIGYFIVDEFELVVRGVPAHWSMHVHHLLIIVCYVIGVARRQCTAYLAATLITEFNGIFLHARGLMRAVGWRRSNSFVYHWNLAALFVSFIFHRLGSHLYILYAVIVDRALFPAEWIWQLALSGMIIINLLNLFLARGIIVSELREAVVSVKKPKKD